MVMFDYIIVVDTDLEGGWSYDGIAHTFGQNGWDFVGSNGLVYVRRTVQHCISPIYIQRYYDAWAFRHLNHPVAHPNSLINMLNVFRGEPMMPVLSAFGGVGIYTSTAFLSSYYSGEDCEHVSFHQRMAMRGYPRIFMNPSQITLYNEPPVGALVLTSAFLSEIYDSRRVNV